MEYGRLALLGGGILVVVLLGWLLVSWLTGGGGESAQQKYFNDLRPIVTSSNQTGKDFHSLMLSSAISEQKFTSQLTTLQQQSQAAVNKATSLKPPKELEGVQPFLLQSLQYRVNGLRCLANNAAAAWKAKGVVKSGTAMAACTQKLLASDVIYEDSFSGASTAILQADKTVAQPPTSQFLAPSDTNLVLPSGFGAAIQRMSKPPTGLHGTEVGKIVAKPSGVVLKGAGPTTVKNSTGLSFQVTIINKGNFTEVQIPIHFKMTHPGNKPLELSKTISSIAAGAKVKVSFGQIFDSSNVPQYGSPYTLTITSDKVPGEVKLDNNTRTTKVTFTVAG